LQGKADTRTLWEAVSLVCYVNISLIMPEAILTEIYNRTKELTESVSGKGPT
jgi:hypothetical protein